jgi:hypothetical protein
MSDIEMVAGSDSDEVLRLREGYAVIRAEPIQKRKRRCGAQRGGKWRRHFSANPVRAAALWRSRPMNGLCGEGRKRCQRASVPNTAAERKGETTSVGGF